MPRPSAPPPPGGLPPSIQKEALLALPVRRYEGPIRLVDTPAALARALEEIRAERVAGFDTETRPAFVRGQSYPPALAQVAVAGAVFLFPLRRGEVHAGLAALLSAAAPVKAGVEIGADLEKLRAVFGFEERSVVDLGALAKRRGFKQGGMRNLAALCLGFRVLKGAQTTNWARRELTAEQIAYAATDAWVCRELYLRFEALGIVPPASRPAPDVSLAP